MAKNQKNVEVKTGNVTEAFPNAMFRVSLDGGDTILTYLSGKMRLHRIRVILGDRVEVELDPYGGKSRIVRRMQ